MSVFALHKMIMTLEKTKQLHILQEIEEKTKLKSVTTAVLETNSFHMVHFITSQVIYFFINLFCSFMLT